jgi:hypothetical protein
VIVRWLRSARDERGASLILAITFMVVVGGVSLATLSYVTNGASQRRILDQARNREYAADGAIEFAIAQVRDIATGGGPGVAPCGTPNAGRADYSIPVPGQPAPPKLNNITIHVDCANAPTLADGGFLQRNVIFTACEGNKPCGAVTVVRAQVNYQATALGGTPIVTRTWIQSWSVNR